VSRQLCLNICYHRRNKEKLIQREKGNDPFGKRFDLHITHDLFAEIFGTKRYFLSIPSFRSRFQRTSSREQSK
ncbi:hypothetical protein P6709_20380, partial [Jeotgalibacillus sp. ET6]|uniref:hypothetical protein n=1 Tax=Jeotgalibacillus sp. ET6 TaxID=3037260 RepID=UPI00241858F5